MLNFRKKAAARVGSALAIVGVVLSPIAVSAATDSDNTTINASISAIISMSTGGTVNLSITPGASGTMSSASDTVSVTTNNATGYVLTFANGDASTSLSNGGNNITASSGTQAAPTALANNTWGYRVDGIGSFGVGPTAAETNQDSSTTTFAGIPASGGTVHTIKTTSGPAADDQTVVWYGAKVDQSLPTGTYTDSVTYTATTN